MSKEALVKEYRTSQIDIKKGHKLYPYFQELCTNGNNLYNTTNFYIRQVYTALNQEKELQPLQMEVITAIQQNIGQMNENQSKAYQKKLAKDNQKPKDKQKKWKENLFEMPTKEKSFLGYNFLDCLFKTIKQKDYYSLPGQINQQVIRNVIQNWKSFFQSIKEFKIHPEKFKGRPSIPGYLPKGGQIEITLSNQICKLKEDKYITFPKNKNKLNIGKLASFQGAFQQLRIIPKQDRYIVEIIFLVGVKKEIEPQKDGCMSIDLGLENIATIVTNTGIAPILFKGGPIKSINQWYNKMRSYYFAVLRNGKKTNEGAYRSKKLNRLDTKRHHQIKDLFHKVSYHIVNIAQKQNIDTIIIGKNQNWKQKIELGKRNNQSFVQVPHSQLIEYITYKAWTTYYRMGRLFC